MKKRFNFPASYAHLEHGAIAYCSRETEYGDTIVIIDSEGEVRSIIVDLSAHYNRGVVCLAYGDRRDDSFLFKPESEIGTTRGNSSVMHYIARTLKKEYYVVPEFRLEDSNLEIEFYLLMKNVRFTAAKAGTETAKNIKAIVENALNDKYTQINDRIFIQYDAYEFADYDEEYGEYWIDDGPDVDYDSDSYDGCMPCRMNYEGNGAYADDDGDNWDF